MWREWVIAILGLWVLLSSFINLDPSTGRILGIISGLIIAVLGIWLAIGKKGGSSAI